MVQKNILQKGKNDGAAFIPIVETRGFQLRRGKLIPVLGFSLYKETTK